MIPDPVHTAVEERFVILGLSAENRARVFVHFFREAKSVIRIISARKAGTKEQIYYRRNKSLKLNIISQIQFVILISKRRRRPSLFVLRMMS